MTQKPFSIVLLAIISLALFGCTIHALDAHKMRKTQDHEFQEKEKYLTQLKPEIMERGYITNEELRDTYDSLTQYRSSMSGPGYRRYSPAARDILITVVEQDKLPFKPMFYLALEKENYEEAEIIRRIWVTWLRDISNALTFDKNNAIKINFQIEKLTTIVGLTDAITVTLRKELVTALNQKRWDEAQKIQSLIAGRLKELTPPPTPQPQITGSGGQTTVVVQQPSRLQIEQLPRYGVSDYARVLSVIGGKSMNSRDAATLKLFDMIIGR